MLCSFKIRAYSRDSKTDWGITTAVKFFVWLALTAVVMPQNGFTVPRIRVYCTYLSLELQQQQHTTQHNNKKGHKRTSNSRNCVQLSICHLCKLELTFKKNVLMATIVRRSGLSAVFRQLNRQCTSGQEPQLKSISAFVNTNVENLKDRVGDEADFVPGHQHHQHGTSHGGHSHGGAKKKFLLNGSQTVVEARPTGSASAWGMKKVERISVDKRPWPGK